MSYLRSNRSTLEAMGSEDFPGVSYIIPDKLYPAVAGKGIDNSTTVTSFGTDFAISGYPTLKYYYTDIKGSKPIKDPRIGAHFGSQRYKFKSIQLLTDETGTHDEKVYSVDGREWLRVVSGTTDWQISFDTWGQYINNITNCTGAYIEIIGYFNDINFIHGIHTDRCTDVDVSVNGTLMIDGNAYLAGDSPITSPLGGRYVDAGSVINAGSVTANAGGQSGTLASNLGTTPAINTIKFEAKTGSSQTLRPQGIELIAQDTTSTANKSKIQMPAQNVVSFGKKFSVSADAFHYDPFNGFTNSTDSHSSYVDTETSFGLSTAPGDSKHWQNGASSTTTHIRPYNGGRVVKWVDSSGSIKTSVTMISPNAQNRVSGVVGTTEVTTPSATNATYTPIFSDDDVDLSHAEVAKTFWWNEFGNGAGNGGTTSTYADASMLVVNALDDIAFTMDDGLTSISGEDVRGEASVGGGGSLGPNTAKSWFMTFIGSGISITNKMNSASQAPIHVHVAQNLPYGTHIMQVTRGASAQEITVVIDGITIINNADTGYWDYAHFQEVTFWQPKMPPIPEDAVVIADYMLMADYLPQTSAGETNIAKGTRAIAGTRDMHYENAAGPNQARARNYAYWRDEYIYTGNVSGSASQELPYFGTSFTAQQFTIATYSPVLATYTINGSNLSSYTLTRAGSGFPSVTSAGVVTKVATAVKNNYLNAVGGAAQLGMSVLKIVEPVSSSKYLYSAGLFVHTPIHTSSHYQPFETPFLNELIGGDRNMEQTNLVVTADGKTWDQVTRNTSYIGNDCVKGGRDTTIAIDSVVVFDDWRGTIGSFTHNYFHNKYFAIAHDRVICLKGGSYSIYAYSIAQNGDAQGSCANIKVNGSKLHQGHTGSSGHSQSLTNVSADLERGDYVQIFGGWHAAQQFSGWWIKKNQQIKKGENQDNRNRPNDNPLRSYDRIS